LVVIKAAPGTWAIGPSGSGRSPGTIGRASVVAASTYAKLRAMVGAVLVLAGLVLFVYATSRGYGAARAALVPLLTEGDPTRTLIDATRPLRDQSRVRIAVRSVAISIGWIVVAGYGLFLASVGARVLA
jgi:hypothetical protein